MIASDINSDKVGPDMSLEHLAGNYSSFLSTLTAGKSSSKIHNQNQHCGYCGNRGHHESECRKKARDKEQGHDPNGKPKGNGQGRGRGRGNPKGGRGRGGRGRGKGDDSPHQGQDTQKTPWVDKKKDDKGKPMSNAQVSDKAVADLCQRLKSGEIKLQLCALESIEVGSRDSSRTPGDLPSLLGGHPDDEAHPSRHDHSEPIKESPILMARSSKTKDKIVLSLCDGMGCMALALRSRWEKLGYTRYIGIEKNKGPRKVCDAANPKGMHFPGVEHGLNGHHDIFDITEDDIKSLPKDSVALLSFGAMCNDFSKLRLLPDRLDYKGPPRKPGVDPRPGLNGKYGKTLRKCIEILGWVTKHHPNAKFFSENVDFSDMKDDWKEVCDALGKPYIINSEDHSFTCRRRAYWTDIPLPDDFTKGYEPKESNDCMDPGRKLQKIPTRGRLSTLPIGASWKGNPGDPVASTNRPVLVIDENHDEPQHLHPEEAEELHGMLRGTTAGDGIQAIDRLHCIGGGWDLNIIEMFVKHLEPQSLEAQTRAYLASLAITSTPSQLEQGESFYTLQKESPDAFNQLVASLAKDSVVQAAKVVALSEHYRRSHEPDDYSNSSIIDSGASRHVSPNVTIPDHDDKVKLTSFTGKATWTAGNGYIPLECHDDLSGNSFGIDIENADYTTETVSTLLSMCKLLRAGWKFDLELGSTFAFTPSGQRVDLIVGSDDVLRIPHTLREGEASKQLPKAPINAAKEASKGVSPEFLHQLFNHSNPDKIHRTLGVTKGIKQPHSPLPGCKCTSCASANARRKGLSHKQYTILHVGEGESDSDEDIPYLVPPESDSESENSIFDEEFIDSDDESIASFDNPIFNEIEEGDGFDDEPFYEDEDHQAETNDYEELRTITELKASREGLTADQSVPRFNIEALRPFEVMFADEKEYDVAQRSGYTTSFVLLDLASDAWFKIDETSKKEHGQSFLRIVVENGIHLLDYPCTLYTDGCGSMRIAAKDSIRAGINHIFIPPHEQSLNEAERIADRAFAAGRTHLIHTGAPPNHMALAVGHVCYMKNRMATSARREWLTPYEIIHGHAPSIVHCMPFYTKAFVHVPKEKRKTLKAKGEGHLRAEEGNLVGYHDMWSTTHKVLLSNNRMVHSRNVTFDLNNFKNDETIKEPESKWDDLLSSKLMDLPEIKLPDLGTSGQHLPNPDTSPEGELVNSPLIDNDPTIIMEDCEVVIAPEDIYHTPPPPPTTRSGRELRPTSLYVPSTSGMEPKLQHMNDPEDPDDPRKEYIVNMAKIQQLSHDLDKFDLAIEHASVKLQAKSSQEGDATAYLIAAQTMADHAQKDMNWKKALDSEHRNPALEALDKELSSLQKTILTEILPSDPNYEMAVLNATPGRLLLDIKRSGKYKVRGVKQGFRENTAVTDGPDFNYYSNVVRLFTVRTALCSRRPSGYIVAIKDVSTAFLQSESYPDGQVKYVSFKHPLSGKWMYFSQSGPIYGEASAPVRWERTIAPWIEDQGFTRGENDRCIFYNADRDLLVLLYVDDCLAKGLPEDVEWFFTLLGNAFECKDTEYLDIDQPQDYLGMILLMDQDYMYLSMSTYIENALSILDVPSRKSSTPMASPIDTDSPSLDLAQKREYLTALGMLGWLAQTVRCDVAYAFSRLGQHCANPSHSALKAVKKVFSYLYETKDLGIRAPLYLEDQHIVEINYEPYNAVNAWRFYSDSDHAGNSEIQNRRRSQNGLVITHNDAPVYWQSKASSVAFASSRIGEAHADISSGAVEIFAAGNATMDIISISYPVEEMGMEFPFPFTLELDNEAARIFANASAQRSKLKHIDCRQEWVKTLRDKSICTPVHIPTKDNLADLFTKILPLGDFIRLRDQLLYPAPM